MPFGTSWHTLLDECDALNDEATLVTPLTETEFRITNVKEHRIVITDTKTGDTESLQRKQFVALADRISDAGGTFQLQRLPPDSEPYAAVLSLHPRYECDTHRVQPRDGDRNPVVTSQSLTTPFPQTPSNRWWQGCVR